MSCANPPLAAPWFSAWIAFALIAPKLIADTFISAIEYGWVQSGPPIRTRGGSSGGSTGRVEWTRYSYPGASTSRSVPNGCSSLMFLARW